MDGLSAIRDWKRMIQIITFFKSFKPFLSICEPKKNLYWNTEWNLKFYWRLKGRTSSDLFCARASDAKKRAVSTAWAQYTSTKIALDFCIYFRYQLLCGAQRTTLFSNFCRDKLHKASATKVLCMQAHGFAFRFQSKFNIANMRWHTLLALFVVNDRTNLFAHLLVTRQLCHWKKHCFLDNHDWSTWIPR